MDASKIVKSALANGDQALSEYRAKQLLQAYGIPVTPEKLATSAEEAVAAAETLGGAVAMKACSPALMHKSESGLIALNVKTPTEVKNTYEDLTGRAGVSLEGVLVQQMISGKRELVLGMIRDEQFGPCVMLGLGGIMTEVLKDTVFRMAPIDVPEAEDMAQQLRSRKILDDFRGEPAANRSTLHQSLMAVGQIGLDLPEVAEIDINPFIITETGDLVAVDALVVLKKD